MECGGCRWSNPIWTKTGEHRFKLVVLDWARTILICAWVVLECVREERETHTNRRGVPLIISSSRISSLSSLSYLSYISSLSTRYHLLSCPHFLSASPLLCSPIMISSSPTLLLASYNPLIPSPSHPLVMSSSATPAFIGDCFDRGMRPSISMSRQGASLMWRVHTVMVEGLIFWRIRRRGHGC